MFIKRFLHILFFYIYGLMVLAFLIVNWTFRDSRLYSNFLAVYYGKETIDIYQLSPAIYQHLDYHQLLGLSSSLEIHTKRWKIMFIICFGGCFSWASCTKIKKINTPLLYAIKTGNRDDLFIQYYYILDLCKSLYLTLKRFQM